MSLNLWKLSGKPTRYNPLPSGSQVALNTLGLNDYSIKVRAKSNLNANLYLASEGEVFKKIITLSSDFKVYEYSFKSTRAGGFFVWDYNNIGDIIIDSISLVQKPLPKLTINGIDGFLSGKWTLPPETTVIDDETIQIMSSDTLNKICTLTIPVVNGQTYTYKKTEGTGRTILRKENTSGLSIFSSNSTDAFIFTVDNSFNGYLCIRFDNNLMTGNFIIKRPMLNLGSIPVPYSKKTGDKMVMPTAKKNLIDIISVLKRFYTSDFTEDIKNGVYCYKLINHIKIFDQTLCNDFEPNTVYTLKFNVYQQSYNAMNGVGFKLEYTDGTYDTFYGVSDSWNIVKFTSNANKSIKRLTTTYGTGSAITYIEKNSFQLEQGTVATPYATYAVQINKKPQRYVPKKNLFDGNWQLGGIGGSNGVIGVSTNSLYNFASNIKGNFTYTFSVTNGYKIVGIYEYDSNGAFLGRTLYSTNSVTFISMATTRKIGIVFQRLDSLNILTNEIVIAQPQLEEGSAVTPYEPYQLVLPKSKKGLSFNGVTDYLQLPSMIMDAIEIECLIDSVQPQSNPFFVQMTGSIFYRIDGGNSNIISIKKNDAPFSGAILKGTRVKYKISFIQNTFTPTVLSGGNGFWTKGILYKVTCYLAGNIVAQYDFENSKNIIGNTVIPNAKNLIPSFDDARWNIHQNAKVLGKDVLHLDATGGSNQANQIVLDVVPNTNYLFNVNANGYIRIYDGGTTGGTNLTSLNNAVVRPTLNTVLVRLFNNSIAGSFDFVKPQLYQLTGKEGTIYGSPRQLNKQAKRNLTAKR